MEPGIFLADFDTLCYDNSISPPGGDLMSDIIMKPIGYVRNQVTERKDSEWGSDISTIIINDTLSGALTGLSDFSHAMILCYLDRAKFIPEKHLLRRPRNRADMPLLGIFSQRTKDHPNPIGITAVEILSVSENSLTVRGLDAIDGTPVLDIKPYFPVFDRRNAKTPDWVDILMKDYF